MKNEFFKYYEYSFKYSVELSGNLSNGWDQVDGSTLNEKGWFSTENFGSNSVDIIGADTVDFVAVLVEGKITVGHEVSCDFFKSIVGSFHSLEDVHFKDILSSVEGSIVDWALQAVELISGNFHKF